MAKRKSITGLKQKTTSIKPKKARKLINKFHALLKDQTMAPPERAAAIQKEIDSLGGLHTYQLASISGQNSKRGGDSSRVLVEWLETHPLVDPSLLEVGCLEVGNACTKSKLFKRIDRIDLNSQHPHIKQQDFMDRPVPAGPESKYGCISLSLVVNFVPDLETRGKMLYHTTRFLPQGGLLFFVLPEPCISNSRYLSLKLLTEMTRAIGYEIIETKKTSKIIYMLLRLDKEGRPMPSFPKQLIKDGPTRNNFAIVF